MIVVIDYGLGNTGSIINMFSRIGVPAILSSSLTDIARADRIVIPGVGSFDQGMKAITERGLREPIDQAVVRDRKPVLGICLGMQLLGRGSEEGDEPGFGWIDAHSRRFSPKPEPDGRLAKVPHMGWNYTTAERPHPLFAGANEDTRFYFVHSYHLVCDRAENVIASSWYGGERFVASAGCENIAGVQFHPEKSHRFGMQILKSFSTWQPAAREAAAHA